MSDIAKATSNFAIFDELLAQGKHFDFDNFARKSERGFPKAFSPEWIAWTSRIRSVVERNFDSKSASIQLLGRAQEVQIIGNGRDNYEMAYSWYMHALELGKRALQSDQFLEGKAIGPADARVQTNKVFIVHGHDERAKQELEIFVREIGLDPIVLHRQVDEGQTIIEKFEKHSDVGYAFVLLTPDDIAFPRSDDTKPDADKKKEFRARQNVILEFGYFIGRLGRANVCCVYTGNVTLPSDMQGLIYKSFNKSIEEIAYSITKELRARGYKLK
jgi:predicted nucleotide-binding protein